MSRFKVYAPFEPTGDQPAAIAELADNVLAGVRQQVLLGATGTGKTFTMAKVIEATQRPTLVIAHNKTLAAQLAAEFKSFFPDNAVEYFVSYYDYYQPEAYIPQSDTYIEKDASINDEIDRLRHSATCSLLERRDVIVVASVSCIYGLGSPDDYRELSLSLRAGAEVSRDSIIRKLVNMQYRRNDLAPGRGDFRARGDVIEIYPVAQGERAVRVELADDKVEKIVEFDIVTGMVAAVRSFIFIYPASHYATGQENLQRAMAAIGAELEQRCAELLAGGRILEAERLRQRTCYDLEMMATMGYCNGIENYSRHITGRQPGQPPFTLIDFFPGDYLLFIDESHVTVPQIAGMCAGDRSRKDMLVEFGFRLPSAYDNRPLTFDEFFQRINQVVYVSATPGSFERQQVERPVEQVIRPTGLIDPEISVRPVAGQVDDLLGQIDRTVGQGDRVLVTTLTKKMAEDLTAHLSEAGVAVRYLHSDIGTLERAEIVRGLRAGEFDVLVGINLLREGLDLPEVGLVAILDADKEGFLRSETSLIQTIGRAARNVRGRVVMYADTVTGSMQRAIDETERRRRIQSQYNQRHGIVPRSVEKAVGYMIATTLLAAGEDPGSGYSPSVVRPKTAKDKRKLAGKILAEMQAASRKMDFERAAWLRDAYFELCEQAGIEPVKGKSKGGRVGGGRKMAPGREIQVP
ncbi:MAG: excinuclease ABC subunit UvrB [Negativicutes bacterium]|nr:excinuclease ABC subunit UvrB [Negativicutes bacterium]